MSLNLPGINPNYEPVKGDCATIALGLEQIDKEYVLHCGVIVGNDLVHCSHDETDDYLERFDDLSEELGYLLLDNGVRNYRFANARFDQNGAGVKVSTCKAVPKGDSLLLGILIDQVLKRD